MYKLNINGKEMSIDVPGDTPLLWAIRDFFKLTGTKYGCGIGLCGACTVHVDGRPLRSCILTVAAAENRQVRTIEALADDPVGTRVQKAWLDLKVIQCGYCPVRPDYGTRFAADADTASQRRSDRLCDERPTISAAVERIQEFARRSTRRHGYDGPSAHQPSITAGLRRRILCGGESPALRETRGS
jgi:hypothetical protein